MNHGLEHPIYHEVPERAHDTMEALQKAAADYYYAAALHKTYNTQDSLFMTKKAAMYLELCALRHAAAIRRNVK